MDKALVSIIIPTFNRSQFIGDAIDSILSQTYNNWECLVIDDGSTDDTASVIAKYCDSDARVTFSIRPETLPNGVNGARNYGVHLSKGDFIAFCDDDDFWLPDKLEKQIAIFKKHSDIGLVSGYIEYVKTDGKRTSRVIEQKENHGYVFESFLLKNRVSMITPMIKRDVYEKVGKFNTDFKIYEDWEYWRRVAYYFKFYNIEEVLACVRKHDSNTTKDIKRSPVEDYILYLNLNAALLKWGENRFKSEDYRLIKKVRWRRAEQILQNHCPSLQMKMNFLFELAKYDFKSAISIILLFLKYRVLSER